MPHPTMNLTVTCWAAPFQLTGDVCGVPFYFRCRHDRWRLEVPGAPAHTPDGADGDGDVGSISEVVALLCATEPWSTALAASYDSDYWYQ
jgi:hypothetical protein